MGAGAAAAVACPQAEHAGPLVGAQPDDGVPALPTEAVTRDGLDTVALQKPGAIAERDVGDEPLACDERAVGLAVSGGAVVVDVACPVRGVPVVLDPVDVDVPGVGAAVHEIERCRVLHAGVGEDDGDIVRQAAAVGVDDVLEHVAGRAAAGEADDGGAGNAVGVAKGRLGWPGRKSGKRMCVQDCIEHAEVPPGKAGKPGAAVGRREGRRKSADLLLSAVARVCCRSDAKAAWRARCNGVRRPRGC